MGLLLRAFQVRARSIHGGIYDDIFLDIMFGTRVGYLVDFRARCRSLRVVLDELSSFLQWYSLEPVLTLLSQSALSRCQ